MLVFSEKSHLTKRAAVKITSVLYLKVTAFNAEESPALKRKAKINAAEVLKQQKNGLEVINDIPNYIRNGWESIPPNERDRLKWVGVFYRKQTPGAFMMRLRMSSGFSNAEQFRVIAEISEAQV